MLIHLGCKQPCHGKIFSGVYKMYLTIYDQNLVALGVVDDYQTVIWVQRDTEYGSFEINTRPTEHNLSLLEKNNIVQKDNGSEVGFINSIQLTDDLDKGPTIKITGFFYCGVLKQRVVLVNSSNLKGLIEKNLRGLPYITVNQEVENIAFDNNFIGENLGDCVTALAKANGFGFYTVWNRTTHTIEFNVNYGFDRSIQQTVNPYVIFSDNYENLFGSEYLNSDVGVINTVYANCKLPAGIEKCTPPTYSITNGVGTGIFEKYIEVDAVTYDVECFLPEGGTVTKTYLDYDPTLKKMQEQANAELVPIQENFQGTVDFKLKYGIDYDLSDIVTVKNNKWNKSINQRITEITEVYDKETDAITPTFGNPARTIMDILKKVK